MTSFGTHTIRVTITGEALDITVSMDVGHINSEAELERQTGRVVAKAFAAYQSGSDPED